MIQALKVGAQMLQRARDGGGEMGLLAFHELISERAQRLEIALEGREVQFFPKRGIGPAQFLAHVT